MTLVLGSSLLLVLMITNPDYRGRANTLNYDNTKLLKQVEQAWETDLLSEFVLQYLASGCGTLDDIRNAIKESSSVQEQDLDNAIKILEMKGLMPEKEHPYKQFVDVYNACVDYEDYEVKNMLAAIYFPHMGNPVWDKAYTKILDNFEQLKIEKSERLKKYEEEKKKEVDRTMNEALDGNIMTIQDLLSNEFENVSDEGLDADIRLYKFIANKLGVANYDNMFVAVDDGNYNPEWLLEDGLMIPYKHAKLMKYESANMIAEFHENGNIFLYFVNEADAEKYFNTAAKFLDDFDVDDNPFKEELAEEEVVTEKVVNKRWTTKSSIEETCTLENLQETLNRRDKLTNNKYDLLNKFLQEARSISVRKELVEKINSNVSDVDLANFLAPTRLVEEASDSTSAQTIEQRLEAETKTNGSMDVDTEDELNIAIDWLVTNGIDYDVEHKNDDTFRIDWYVGVDASSADVNKELAKNMKETLSRVMEMLNDIIESSDPVRAAFYNDQYIRETLSEVLKDCDKFDY